MGPGEKFDPREFVGIPYRVNCYPGRVPLKLFRSGSNCQLFILGVLSEVGFRPDPLLRSQELWIDNVYTHWVGTDPTIFQIFDVLFFFPKSATTFDSKRFHLGLYVFGVVEGLPPCAILHNARPGPSSIQDFESFRAKYNFFGAKRPRP